MYCYLILLFTAVKKKKNFITTACKKYFGLISTITILMMIICLAMSLATNAGCILPLTLTFGPQPPKKPKKRTGEGANSNVFSMFEQAQIQEFKEVSLNCTTWNYRGELERLRFCHTRILKITFPLCGRKCYINILSHQVGWPHLTLFLISGQVHSSRA